MPQIEKIKKHLAGWVKDGMVLFGSMAAVSLGIHFYNAQSEAGVEPGEVTKLFDTRFEAGRTFAQVSEYLVAETHKKVVFAGDEGVPGLEQSEIFDKRALESGEVGYVRPGNDNRIDSENMWVIRGWGGSRTCLLTLLHKPASEYAKSPFDTNAKSMNDHLTFWHEIGHCVRHVSDSDFLPEWSFSERQVKSLTSRILKDPSKVDRLLAKQHYKDFSDFALMYYDEVYADVYGSLAVRKFLDFDDERVYQHEKNLRTKNLYAGEKGLYLLSQFSIPYLYELRRLTKSGVVLEGETVREKAKNLMDSKPRFLSVDYLVKLYIFTALVTGDLNKSDIKDDSWIEGFELV